MTKTAVFEKHSELYEAWFEKNRFVYIVGFVDKNSPVGEFYQSNKDRNPFYIYHLFGEGKILYERPIEETAKEDTSGVAALR